MEYMKLERPVGKSEKLETLKLESSKLNWKERNWKIRAKVVKFLENYFNIALKTFQLRSVLSNLNGNFITSEFSTQIFPTRFFRTDLPTNCIPNHHNILWDFYGNLYHFPSNNLRVIYESFYGFQLFDFGKVPKTSRRKMISYQNIELLKCV